MQVERRVTDLSPEDRRVMERLLGRPLQDNELVRVTTDDGERAEAWAQFLESNRRMQASFSHIPEEELDDLINEAIQYVRNNPA
jgi:hypothetical protein